MTFLFPSICIIEHQARLTSLRDARERLHGPLARAVEEGSEKLLESVDSFTARFTACPQDHVEREGGGKQRGSTEVRILRLYGCAHACFFRGQEPCLNQYVPYGLTGIQGCEVTKELGHRSLSFPPPCPIGCRPVLARQEIERDQRQKVEAKKEKEKAGAARRGKWQQESEGRAKGKGSEHLPKFVGRDVLLRSDFPALFALLKEGRTNGLAVR